jgi:6,7-dimethyl-8-ribityllumazine synthase
MSGAGRPDAAAVDAAGLGLAIVATRWHQEITDPTRSSSGYQARSSSRWSRPSWPRTTTR